MRISTALASLWLLLAASAQALTADPKLLARFDTGYAQCEKRFPHMQGQRDPAFLALWKARPDTQARAQLAAVRKGSAYQRERRLALKHMAKSTGPDTENKLKQQCQATWAEAQRNAPAARPGANPP